MEAQTETADDIFLPAKKVRQRYGDISDMSLWRWLHDEEMKFPQPEYFGRRRFWKLSTLEKWERLRGRRSTEAA